MAKVLVNKPEKWERVNDENDYEITQRLRIFGGWLVITTRPDYHTECLRSIAQSFVPDPNHEWEI